MSEATQAFITGILLGLILAVGICSVNGGKHTRNYLEGVKSVQKEAFEHGLMIKEVDKNDRVIYRWVETHKIGYEN